jgi:hypothetical protein
MSEYPRASLYHVRPNPISLHRAQLTSNIMIYIQSITLVTASNRSTPKQHLQLKYASSGCSYPSTTHQLATRHAEYSDRRQSTYSIRPPPHHLFLKFAESTLAHLLGPGNGGCVLVVSLFVDSAQNGSMCMYIGFCVLVFRTDRRECADWWCCIGYAGR